MSSNTTGTKEESNLGLEKARVWEIKVMRFFVLIRLGIFFTSIGLSLYIYRPEKTYPFTSRITWGLFIKTLILLGLYKPDRSDRSARPVRPVDLSRCQIWLLTYAPCFLVSFTSQKARTILMYMFYTEHTSLKNKTKCDIQYRPSSSSCTLPYARIELLQVSPIDSPW